MRKGLCMLAATLAFPVSALGQDLDAKLLAAAKGRNTAEVQKLLAEGADLNAKDKDGWNALAWAVYFGRTATVRALLEKGADANTKLQDGETALMNAASMGDQDIVRALLKKGADVNARDNDGWTALSWAASSGRTDTVRTLLEKGADVNARSNQGQTALMCALYLGRTNTVLILLEKGADVAVRDKEGDTALDLAEKYKYSEISALLRNPPQVTQDKSPKNTSALTTVASPTISNGTFVPQPEPARANSKDSQSLDKKLLDAAESGDTSEVLSLIKAGANLSARGEYGTTVLMSAAVRGHLDTVRALLKAGADVNAKGNTGRTALMEAALEGYLDPIQALIENGADVNAKDNEGWTALFWAAYSRRTETVRTLLEKGADVNAKNKYDDTALIRAAHGGDLATVAVLLEKGADVNSKDDMGRTALIEAAGQGHLDTVRILLEKGADITLPARDGATALSEAQKHNYSDVIGLLKNPPGTPLRTGATTSIPNVSSAVTAPNSAPVMTETQASEKRIQEHAFYRLGLKMQMMEDLWPHAASIAAPWASSIQQDLMKLGAPSDLIELARQAAIHLSLSPREHNGPLIQLIRDLRARLDGFCEAQTAGRFFYTAGGFTYSLILLGEAVGDPNNTDAIIEESRRKALPIANAMAAECSATEGCKEHAISYFLAATTLLKKSNLIPSDGLALSKASADIEQTLSGDEH